MNRRLLLSVIFSGMALGLASTTWAQVNRPAFGEGSNPPVRQDIAMLDSTISGVEELDCRICHPGSLANKHHSEYGKTLPPTQTVPNPDADGNLIRDTKYSCLTCHVEGGIGGFVVITDCGVCHTTSPHHQTDEAIDRHCSHCHGSFVADYNDGHYIPIYAASLVTPKMGNSGEGFNEDGTPERISTGLGFVAFGDVPAGPQTRQYPNALTFTPPGINNDFIISAPRGTVPPYTVEFRSGALDATWTAATQSLLVFVPAAPTTVTANDVISKINTKIGKTWASLGFDGDPTNPATLYDITHYATAGGETPNNRGLKAGYCSYCHDDDGATDVNGDPKPVLILNNHDTHHNINLPDQVADGVPGNPMTPTGKWRKCNVCHDYANRSNHVADLPLTNPPTYTLPNTPPSYNEVGGPRAALHIRVCEECHSVASLHSIQADSSFPSNGIVTGGELAGYGHRGRDAGPGDSDCWGCHGFAMSASETLTGPVIPTVYNSDLEVISAGKDTTIVLSGAAFTDTSGGKQHKASIRLTAANGSSVTLQPEIIVDQGAMAVKIPANTRPGNYRLQAMKGEFASNPVVINVSPVARISRATYQGTVTILGTGFAGYAKGSPTSVTATVTTGSGRRVVTKTVEAKIVSWTDTKIVADFGVLPGKVTVNSIFGSSTASVSRK